MKEKLLNSIRRSKNLIGWSDLLGGGSEIGRAYSTFSVKQKGMIAGLFILGTVSILIGLWFFNQSLMVTVAVSGGQLTEGIVGSPSFINPLLAISDADRDLTALVYSGLMKLGPNGELIPDLAESYEVSDDWRTYTFTLKDGLTWQDGRKLTARDVVFTVLKAQNPATRSTRFAAWEKVGVEQSGEKTITFTLARPYAPFLENLTMGILPTHLWVNLEAESFSFSNLNINPVGSGPYKIKKIKKDSSGIPLYYDLEPFENYALGKPKIETVRIRFYPNENELRRAFTDGKIEAAHAITPEKITDLPAWIKILTEPLPRIFGVFFNQNQAPVLTHKEVRQALNLATPKQKIIDQVLAGFGQPLESPIMAETPVDKKVAADDNLNQAAALLENNGWQKDDSGQLIKKTKAETRRLEFSIATADIPELKQTAEIIKASWEKLGAKIELKIFETGNLNQTVIRPRKYDALLFGIVLGRQPDLYPFWHSSGRLDPGLNIAQYANITADKLLDDLRVTADQETIKSKLAKLETEIKNDQPAVFLYAPEFIYIVPEKIKNISIKKIADSSERFANIHNWYIKTDRIWKILATDDGPATDAN